MRVQELLAELNKNKVVLNIENGKLKIKVPKGVSIDHLVPEVRQKKDEIIEMYTNVLYREQSGIINCEKKDYYLSSSVQKRLYILQQMNLESTAYNMPYEILMGKEVDKEKIKEVFQQLIARHESFRTCFEIIGEETVQRIHEQVEFKFAEFSIAKEEKGDLKANFIQPFDLSEAPLLRVALVKTKESENLLMIDMHHIISDGVSHSILKREFKSLYLGEELLPLKLQYNDYSNWQNSVERQKDVKEQEEYWLKKFDDEIPVLNLPIDYIRSSIKNDDGANVRFVLSKEETNKIKLFTKENDLTLYLSILSVFTILLSKLSGQKDIIVGTPTAGRNHSELEQIMGMFVNTLAIRNEVLENDTLIEFISKLKQSTLDAFDNQDYQFEDLVEKVSVQRDLSRNPIFDVMFNMLNHEEYSADLSGLANQEGEHHSGISKIDLCLGAVDYGERIMLSFDYSTKLFKAETIERYIGYFKQIVNQLPTKLQNKISEIEIVSSEEKQQLLHEFNNTKTDYPKDKTIHQLFEEQAERTPNNIALVFGSDSITYSVLNTKSNQLAHHLKEGGLILNDSVGLMVERSIEMIIGVFGILKAGGLYVPIDLSYPEIRIKYILKNSNSKLILSKTPHIEKLDSTLPMVLLDDVDVFNNEKTNLNLKIKPEDLSYIIYTSGSTGNPKGVQVEHSSVVNILFFLQEKYSLNENDSYLLKTSYCFDVSVSELFGWILGSGKLIILKKDQEKDPNKLIESIYNFNITHINFVPTVFKLFSQFVFSAEKDKMKSLKYILIAGEALLIEHLQEIIELNLEAQIVNLYGPTEATVYTSNYTISFDDSLAISIGKPNSNYSVYIVNSNNKLQPIGVPGELCISGVGLSRGYINNENLTKEKFIEHPFNESERLYKTGDLARWLPDGNIEFLGRIDNQVKIRGFRIELGEIESVLLKHTEVNEAVVISREDSLGDKFLCAYFVSESQNELKQLLRSYLSGLLPEYMIPAYFIQLEKIPLTLNGKINKKLLPEPEIKAGSDYVAPKNEIEEKLVEIWSKVIGIEEHQISVRANFFELGGHSLKATILASRIYRELGVKISLSEIFRTPIIIDLAIYVRKSTKYKYESINVVEQKEYYELSYAQRRLWILCQFEEDSTAYNMPVFFPITGDLNVEALEKSFQTLLERHESLQTIFITVEGEPKQKLLNDFKFRLEQIDLSDLSEKEIKQKTKEIYINDANTAFDLETGPLFRSKLIYLGKDKYVLIFNIHHIINDGWSHGIIYNELTTLYYSFLSVNENPLAPLELQYKDYTIWNNSLTGRGKFDKSEKYWLEKFKDKPNGLELPFDHSRQVIQTFNGGRITFSINKEQTQKIQQISTENNSTLFMSLLSLVSILLNKYTSQKDIIIGSPIAGRKYLEFDNMIGFLVNTLVFRIDLNPEENFISLLNKIKRETIACYENQDYPFDLLIEKLELDRDLSQSPLFNVMVAHNNTDKVNTGKADEVNTPNQSVIESTNKEDYDYIEDFNMSKFDLIFFIDEIKDHLSVKIEYNSDLFERESIKRMADNFTTLLNEVLKNIEKPINILEYIDRREYVQITEQFNDNKYEYPKLTVQELFEQQVQKTPEKHAIIWNNETISYDDLNKKSNQLAWYLRNTYNIKSNDVIGLSIQRSIEMVIGILGIIKSGAAYLAIDPTYPEDRVLHILEDSEVKLILIDKIHSGLYDKSGCTFLNINSDWEKISLSSTSNLPMINKLNDILYVIYTSGSTGTPNGAMLSHGILTNLVQWQKEDTSIESSLRCLQFTSVNFCVSFQEIMTTLTSGGELYLIGEIERQDIDYLMKFLSDNKIEILYLPFSYLNFLFNESGRWEHHFKHNIKHIITAGEQLKITTGLRSFLNQNSEIYLHNHYGSSEMHVVTALTIDSTLIETTQLPPAGKPIANTSIYILDEYYQPNSIGVWGELFISSSTEVLGYINNGALSDKKILEIPVLKHNKKLYRSGDIGRWLPDGNIELKGRKDEQFKIRGFRVELGEIESKLLGIKEVKECVVVVREDEFNNKYLLAYIVIENLDAFIIKRQMSSFLPKYMIPRLVVLDSLPLMPNGKVDRSKLPEPELDLELEYVAPTNKIETKLTEIWSEILAIEKEKIGINANFFDLGGHSLKATTLASKIQNEFNVKIPLTEIFKYPVIKEISLFIEMINLEKNKLENEKTESKEIESFEL